MFFVTKVGLNGEVDKARRVFKGMKERDNGTWSAMIKVYERKGYELEALGLFRRMQREGLALNFPSLISVLSVCVFCFGFSVKRFPCFSFGCFAVNSVLRWILRPPLLAAKQSSSENHVATDFSDHPC